MKFGTEVYYGQKMPFMVVNGFSFDIKKREGMNYIEVVNLNIEDKTFVSWHTLGSLNIISTNMPENMILMYLESLRRNYDLLLEGCSIKGECLKPTDKSLH